MVWKKMVLPRGTHIKKSSWAELYNLLVKRLGSCSAFGLIPSLLQATRQCTAGQTQRITVNPAWFSNPTHQTWACTTLTTWSITAASMEFGSCMMTTTTTLTSTRYQAGKYVFYNSVLDSKLWSWEAQEIKTYQANIHTFPQTIAGLIS